MGLEHAGEAEPVTVRPVHLPGSLLQCQRSRVVAPFLADESLAHERLARRLPAATPRCSGQSSATLDRPMASCVVPVSRNDMDLAETALWISASWPVARGPSSLRGCGGGVRCRRCPPSTVQGRFLPTCHIQRRAPPFRERNEGDGWADGRLVSKTPTRAASADCAGVLGAVVVYGTFRPA